VQEAGSAPRPFLNTEFNETSPAVSPDGRFIADSSDESGRPEVYVRPWPGPGTRYQVSTAGGTGALWSKDGRTLYYAEWDVMMEVGIATTPAFQAAQTVKLFSGKFGWARPGNSDVTADRTRFVMIEMLRGAEAPDLRVVTNWLAEIRTKLP
jgi:serine/threonine-protein kinase